MKLSDHKTKIVCTIGPSSNSVSKLQDLIKSGMNVARLNFSHGDLFQQKENIRAIRRAAAQAGRRVSILIDLPGVKMRLGKLKTEPLVLKKGEKVVLTTEQVLESVTHIPIDYKQLAKSVSRGSVIYLSDGFIQLAVESIAHHDVVCRVMMGGTLLSHKGLNLPGAKIFTDAVTDTDLRMMDFGLQQGVTIFGLSFIEKADDIMKARAFAKKKGKAVHLIAKIERLEAIKNFEEILKAADAVMIARGDLGVEIPVEEVPVIQKRLIRQANIMGKPVITATQMLESMTHNIRPTRAEVNDVANAIIDGTDSVMLSEETAIGEYPVETVKMMAKTAAFTEAHCRVGVWNNKDEQMVGESSLPIADVISLNAVRAAEELNARYVLTPTTSGNTARRISRFKPRCWTLAFSRHEEICEFLNFSYGVHPFLIKKKSAASPENMFKSIKNLDLVKKGGKVIITERRLSDRPGETDSLGIVTIE